ncbi:DUF2497 domain-containing protein [Sphingobium boeckii]|uniref:DUF2497 domain-containing protein n=1 Tax=Sphingobium boeckii TaxID=1082345 RepID=A0A7W9AHZ9_9SPHN|nr:DUF2497 domain-containing protein [Sphingobium boeckii]MBB5685841.1 hypothetical protein [Sphingobium boeckii]
MGDISSEPSMEDILSSIKRIIADEGDAAISARARPLPRRLREVPKAESEEVLELTDAVEALAERGSMTTPAVDEEPELVSENAATASRTALASLASLSAVTVKPEVEANTLEGLVREMLRPMLKEWLDAKLPELVETMVAREIARITGKGV